MILILLWLLGAPLVLIILLFLLGIGIYLVGWGNPLFLLGGAAPDTPSRASSSAPVHY
jgi:hypothetical protein